MPPRLAHAGFAASQIVGAGAPVGTLPGVVGARNLIRAAQTVVLSINVDRGGRAAAIKTLCFDANLTIERIEVDFAHRAVLGHAVRGKRGMETFFAGRFALYRFSI